jgi:hypothetical protein
LWNGWEWVLGWLLVKLLILSDKKGEFRCYRTGALAMCGRISSHSAFAAFKSLAA